MVAVNLWYHVGSKNERPGRTGFAHLFEHLMFEGSSTTTRATSIRCRRRAPRSTARPTPIAPTTGRSCRRSALELALWMESDRMGYLLPALTEQKFENQRDVVLNERRQNYENRPYGLAGMAIVGALYPPDHPVSLARRSARPTICSAATLDDVRAFFRDVLPPRQCVAGDRRRRRHRRGVRPGRASTSTRSRPGRRRRPCRRRRRARRRGAAACSRIGSSCRGCTWRGIRRRCSRRRCRDGSGGRSAGQRQDLAALYGAGLRAAHRDRRVGVCRTRASWPGSSRSWRPRRPARRWPSCSRPSRREIDAAAPATAPRPTRWSAASRRPKRSSSYRLQTLGGFGGKSDQLNAYSGVSRRPGLSSPGPAALPRGDAPTHCAAAARQFLGRDRRVVLSVVPRGRADWPCPGPRPVEVS